MEEKCLRILQLAMLLNATPTKQELTGETPTVFIDWAGHISGFEVSIHSKGWDGDCPDKTFETHYFLT